MHARLGSDYLYPKFPMNEYRGKARGYVRSRSMEPNLTLDEFLTDYKAERKN